MRIVYHPITKKAYLLDQAMPLRKSQIVQYLKERGYHRVYKMTLGQLRNLWCKVVIEERGIPVCRTNTT